MDKEQLIQDIPEWMTNYLSSTSLDGFIVGISGGIDSALTSTLCALTGKPTHVVSLPIYQKPEQLSRAHKHQKWYHFLFTKNQNNYHEHTNIKIG